MDQTIVGLFSTPAEAQSVVKDLTNSGFKSSQITVTNNDTISTTVANNANPPSKHGGFWDWLLGNGIPETEAGYYAEGVRRQGQLVTVSTAADMAKQAADIMARHHAINVDKQSEEWKKSGWTGYDPKAAAYTGAPLSAMAEQMTANADGKTVLPVVEEQLQVGKREVEGGTVRIYSRVTERPVEEQVTLRQEHVTVERHPVDRAVTAADADLFQEKTIEMVEHSEEAVVSKSARVVEEVVISKDVSQRTDTVRDTVRRVDVEVDQAVSGKKMPASTVVAKTTGNGNFDSYATDFRSHYDQAYAKSGYSFDDYTAAYHYGFDLAHDDRYSASDWTTVAPQARTAWEQKNPGTWDKFQAAVQYGWEKATNKVAL